MVKADRINIKFNIVVILSIIVFAFAISPKTLQNDTFYTIEIGEYILKNGITMQDPFSWHNLSYTFPHWAYDVMIYLIYSIGGHLGIYLSTIFFSSILGILMYIINIRFSKNEPVSFVLTIGILFLLKYFLAARAQLFTFILFALEILFIECFLDTGKKRYVFGLIFIPILLANFHVAVFPFYFILYLPYLAEYFIYLIGNLLKYIIKKRIIKIQNRITKQNDSKIIEKLTNKLNKLENNKEKIFNIKKKEPYKINISYKKNTKILIIIMIVCLFAGLLTPLKGVPYTYLVNTMRGNSTSNISEHLPLVLANNLNFAVVIIFFIAIMMFTDTKIRLCDLFMLGGLIFLTFMSRRQESMFIIICVPIFNRMVTSFINKYDKNGIQEMKKIMTSFCGIFVSICLVLIISIINYNNKYKSDYVSKTTYPVEAAEWILDNLDIDKIKLYNEYNYGSYLLFKGIPVFIDSRADLYLPEFNEGVTIFDDFLKINNLNTMDIDKLFEKYNFTHFIVYSKTRLRIYLDSRPQEYSIIYNDDNFYIYEKL